GDTGSAYVLVQQVVYFYLNSSIVFQELVSQTHIPQYGGWIESCGCNIPEIIVGEVISEDDILWPVGGGFNSKGMVDIFLLTIVANSEVTENIIHGITRIDVDQFFIVITKTYRRSYAQSVGVIPHLVGETDLAAVIGISTQPVAELAV